MAGAGRFEPPHGGIKFRCLTDLPCSGTGRCIRRRNSSLWRPRRLDHNARRDAPLSFAQFEREGIGERIRDKIAASNRKCGGCLLLALQSQFSEHLAILWVELPFHIDFARRHLDEKIIRMRIDVGDVGDAQLPPAPNLTLGVGLYIQLRPSRIRFLPPRRRPRWPRSCAVKRVGRDRFP